MQELWTDQHLDAKNLVLMQWIVKGSVNSSHLQIVFKYIIFVFLFKDHYFSLELS
jgi:hypothetical protein